MHTPRRLVLPAVAALSLLVIPPLTAPATAQSTVTAERSVAPGVHYRALHDPAGPFSSYVVTVDPGTSASLDTALAQGRLEGFEPTSSLASRHGAVVAVNGDFAMPSGRPLHSFAEDGKLLQAPRSGGIGVRATGRDGRAYLSAPKPVMQVRALASGRGAPLARLNSDHATVDELSMMTPEAGGLEVAPPESCSARLRQLSRVRRDLYGNTTSYTVEQTGCGAAAAQPNGATLLSAPTQGRYAGFVNELVPGTTVDVSWALGRPHTTDLLGAHGVQLLSGGAVNPAVDGSDPFHARNPRTGLGVMADGRTVLAVVDGRQPGYSVGMTLREFAEHMRGLGSVDAVLLDGGGSSTMVVQGQIVNRPSDGAERPVANALLVQSGEGRLNPVPFVASPQTARESARTGQRILDDPGSTGGWAERERRKGAALPDELKPAKPAKSKPGKTKPSKGKPAKPKAKSSKAKPAKRNR